VGGERWREAETLSVREGEAETIGLSRERERDTVEREYGGRRSWSVRELGQRRVGRRETRSIWATSEIWCRSVRELGVDLGADRWAGLLGSTARATSASDLGGRSVLGPTERELGVGSTGFERLRGRASGVGVGKGVEYGFSARGPVYWF